MRATFLLLPLFLLACDGQSASDQAGANAPPPPPLLCAQARKGLEEMGKGAILYDDKGEATVPREIWMAMGTESDQFVRALALHAACSHPDGAAERQVRVRDESGVVLSEAVVPVAVGLDSLGDQ